MRSASLGLIMLLVAACAGTNFQWSTVQQLKPGASFDDVCQELGSRPQQVTYKEDGSFVAGWGYGDLFGGAKAVSLRFDKDRRYVGLASTWSPYAAPLNAVQEKQAADFMVPHGEGEQQ